MSIDTDGGGVREDELHAFIDGRLGERRRREVLAWLGRHPDELQRLARYAAHEDDLRRRLDAFDWHEAGDDGALTGRLQRELAEQLTRRPVADRTLWLRRATAAALLLGAGWWGHALYEGYPGWRLPSVVVAAAQAHQVFGEERQRPVELTAASKREMAAWFSERLGEPVEIPSLHAIGLRLVGGRLLPGEDAPVAQLIYEDSSGHRLTLALTPEPPDRLGPEVRLAEVEGLTAGYWQDGELSYAVVAETSEQQLVTIASEIGAREPEGVL